jgi:hypothetical protein
VWLCMHVCVDQGFPYFLKVKGNEVKLLKHVVIYINLAWVEAKLCPILKQAEDNL